MAAPAIARHYQLDPTRPGPGFAGVRSFAAFDQRDPGPTLAAIAAEPGRPPRRLLAAARERMVPHTLPPLDFGPGQDPAGAEGWFMLCPMPPGPALAPGEAWREPELIAQVLIPVAEALDAMAAEGWTHRAIRPDNLFRARAGEPVTTGPFWALPPAVGQPALFEPPYVAVCPPEARGEGSIADDIYALGVTLLVLALGRLPLAGLPDAQIIERKIALGSFAALTEGAVLPSLLVDLLRGMLAEDPEHRPAPSLLLDPREVRSRRLALRPPARAQRPFELGSRQAWTAREVAQLVAADPDRGVAALRSGAVQHWVRRTLGDPLLAARMEEVGRGTEWTEDAGLFGAMLAMRWIAVLDPLGPMRWRGVALWPDGIGPVLAAGDLLSPEVTEAVVEAVERDAVPAWVAARGRREGGAVALEAREWRRLLAVRGWAGGRRRLAYALNPFLACASRLPSGAVVRLGELLPALERAAGGASAGGPPADAEIAAFLAARGDPVIAADAERLPGRDAAMLMLFGRLQSRLQAGKLPGIAGWLLASGAAGLERWANRRTRETLRARLASLAEAGDIGAMAALVEPDAAREADRQGRQQAAARVAAIEAALAGLEGEAGARAEAASALGLEIAGALGMIACCAAALAALLG